jgi:hypothetical protein
MSCHACLQNAIFSKIFGTVTISSLWSELSGVYSWQEKEIFSLQNVNPGNRAQPDPYNRVPEGYFSGKKKKTASA